jgi:hypothetical protein
MRKSAVFAAFLAVVAAVPAAAAGDGAAFTILRKGEPIGRHVVEISQDGSRTIVETTIRMRVKFGPLVLYRYDHAAREVWEAGALIELESRTDDNGEAAALKADRVGDRLYVDGTGYEGFVPAAAAPSSYWTRSVVDAPLLLNTQNGELIEVTTSRVGVTAAPGGGTGEEFRIVGTLALSLWYDGERWIGSDFTIDGERLTYVPEPRARADRRFVSAQ